MCQNFGPGSRAGMWALALRAELVPAEQPHRRAAAALPEWGESAGGDARSADLLERRPERLCHALEMRRVERAGESDGEAILAQYVRIAEALQQQALIVVEGGARMLRPFGLGGRRGEILEGRDALRREPVERRRRLDRAQHEIAAGTRQGERPGLDRLAACGETDQPRLDILAIDAIAQGKRRAEQRMQAGIAAGGRGELGEASAGETGIGESLQGDAVIGAAEP